MGKTGDRESLIRLIVNTVVHEIVLQHTHRPESSHFLHAEIIEYKSQAEKAAQAHHWNDDDKLLVEEKALEKIKEKLETKYTDVEYDEEESTACLKELIDELM